jgi:hypothetical protein
VTSRPSFRARDHRYHNTSTATVKTSSRQIPTFAAKMNSSHQKKRHHRHIGNGQIPRQQHGVNSVGPQERSGQTHELMPMELSLFTLTRR